MLERQTLLSVKEIEQLGSQKPNSDFRYTDLDEWLNLRTILVQRSLRSNPQLQDVEMTAYTPGETLLLLKNPKIQQWHRDMSQLAVDRTFETLVLVPCAKTKPWDKEHSRKSSLYRAYNRIKDLSDDGKIRPVYFITLSEPLGVVPQSFWGSFPQYDNPGLFRDGYMRTGLMNDEVRSILGEKRLLPFDEEAYRSSIEILGGVIADFLSRNLANRTIYSFVDNTDREQSTHQAMLTQAIEILGSWEMAPHLSRFPKRPGPRKSPYEHILSHLTLK